MIRMTRVFVPSVALCVLITSVTAGAAPPSKPNPDPASSASAHNAPTNQIDINSATLVDLRSLPGIGDAGARKIVAGRPYVSVDDLKTRKVLRKGTYDRIRDRISAKSHMGTAAGDKPNLSVPGTGMH